MVEISHPCSFTPDDWRTLEKFADYAADLSRTALVSTGSGLSFSLTSDDDGVRFESKAMPDSDQVSALLHRMRPFVLKKEPTTYLPRVRNILARQLDHPAFHSYLARQKEIFEGRRQQAMLLVSQGQVINSTETLEQWLNAYEYHRDDDKRGTFEALHDDTRHHAPPFSRSRRSCSAHAIAAAFVMKGAVLCPSRG
jgi:hypothetical protein